MCDGSLFQNSPAVGKPGGSPGPQGTHSDMMRMEPSRVPRHILSQVCALQKMVARARLVVVGQGQKQATDWTLRGTAKLRIFENNVQKAHSRFSETPLLKSNGVCLSNQLLLEGTLFLDTRGSFYLIFIIYLCIHFFILVFFSLFIYLFF